MTPHEIQQSIEAVVNGLTPLAQQLQVPANKIFEFAIRQNYVYAINDILAILGLILFLTIGIIFANKESKKEKPWDSYTNTFAQWACIISFIFAAFSFIISLIQLPDLTARLINPEYMALKDLFNIIIK